MSMLSRRKSSKIKDPLPRTVEDATEEKGPLPQEYHMPSLRERRLLAALRAVSLALFASIAFSAILAFIIVSLLPLKEVRPFLVRIADEGTVVADIRPMQDQFNSQDLLTEQLVREYVINRHEILRSDDIMTRRWGPRGYLQMTSSDNEYKRFINSSAETLRTMRGADAQVLATIQSVTPISLGKSYVVDFRLITYGSMENIVQDSIYTATIELEFKALTGLTRNEMLINPTGFTVNSYSLAEKNQ